MLAQRPGDARQLERVRQLFNRQLQVPLPDGSATYEQYKGFEGEDLCS